MPVKNRFALLAAGMVFAASAGTNVSCGTEPVHPAVQAAMKIIAAKLPDVKVRLEVVPGQQELRGDGYTVIRKDGVLVVRGARPRSLLFAAGETGRWLAVDKAPFVRDAAFSFRLLNYAHSSRLPAEWIAATGCNAVHVGHNAPGRLAAGLKALDIEAYAFLYGCDPKKWNAAECEAFLAAHPSARAKDPGHSWEKGVMCPSDPATWEFFAGKIRSVATVGDYDGVVVTFWDNYGLNCHCVRCRKNGLAGFPRQIAAVTQCFEEALKPLGKKLIVRTWASGAPHFLGEEWVHAPGYASVEEAVGTWGRTFETAAADTVFQTKVYNADCQPDPPFSHLLGKAKRHPEIAEWQITGQTVGLQHLAAAVVEHVMRTMKRAFPLTKGYGVCLYAGGYRNRGYEALSDPVNSINIHVWRQLSWNPDDDLDAICREWAEPVYGASWLVAVKAIRLSEAAAVASFSPLGLGAPTESCFPKTVSRREDLLRYTNRQYLPEGRAALEPTKANIARVVAQKDAALKRVAEMERLLSSAPQPSEALDMLKAKTARLKAHLLCTKALDGALWRLRYLRYLCMLGSTDTSVLREIEMDAASLRAVSPEVPAALGSPASLMKDIQSNAVACVERIVGPEGRKAR